MELSRRNVAWRQLALTTRDGCTPAKLVKSSAAQSRQQIGAAESCGGAQSAVPVTFAANWLLSLASALVAQLDRASDFESEGREFESLRARSKLRLSPRTRPSVSPLYRRRGQLRTSERFRS